MNQTTRLFLTLAALLLLPALTRAQMNGYISDNDLSDRQMHTVEFLSDSICQGRGTSSRGSFESIAYISAMFRDCALSPLWGKSYLRRFSEGLPEGMRGCNIAGMIKGREAWRHARPYIVVGAHFDHLGMLSGKMYPGADDNASGIAAMQYVMESFAAMCRHGSMPGRNIIFVAFDGKEYDMAGSKAFMRELESMGIGPERIAFMVNIDQIGSVLEPVDREHREYMIVLGKDRLEVHQQAVLEACSRYFVPGLKVIYDYYGSGRFTSFFEKASDQKSFIDCGVPSLLFTSGINKVTYKPSDSMGVVDRKALLMRSKAIYVFLERLSRGRFSL